MIKIKEYKSGWKFKNIKKIYSDCELYYVLEKQEPHKTRDVKIELKLLDGEKKICTVNEVSLVLFERINNDKDLLIKLGESVMKYIGNANYNSYDNDMFWKMFYKDPKTGEYFKIELSGYNDSYWWNEVAPKKEKFEVIGSEGTTKSFRIDYKTNEVFEL